MFWNSILSGSIDLQLVIEAFVEACTLLVSGVTFLIDS